MELGGQQESGTALAPKDGFKDISLYQLMNYKLYVDLLQIPSNLRTRRYRTMKEKAIAKYGFRITDNTVESDSAAPRICAEFSEPLAKAGVDYDTYVRLPDASLVVQASGSQLCVDGVQHGNRYRVTFREGLPAASGETLYKDVELTQYV